MNTKPKAPVGRPPKQLDQYPPDQAAKLLHRNAVRQRNYANQTTAARLQAAGISDINMSQFVASRLGVKTLPSISSSVQQAAAGAQALQQVEWLKENVHVKFRTAVRAVFSCKPLQCSLVQPAIVPTTDSHEPLEQYNENNVYCFEEAVDVEHEQASMVWKIPPGFEQHMLFTGNTTTVPRQRLSSYEKQDIVNFATEHMVSSFYLRVVMRMCHCVEMNPFVVQIQLSGAQFEYCYKLLMTKDEFHALYRANYPNRLQALLASNGTLRSEIQLVRPHPPSPTAICCLTPLLSSARLLIGNGQTIHPFGNATWSRL